MWTGPSCTRTVGLGQITEVETANDCGAVVAQPMTWTNQSTQRLVLFFFCGDNWSLHTNWVLFTLLTQASPQGISSLFPTIPWSDSAAYQQTGPIRRTSMTSMPPARLSLGFLWWFSRKKDITTIIVVVPTCFNLNYTISCVFIILFEWVTKRQSLAVIVCIFYVLEWSSTEQNRLFVLFCFFLISFTESWGSCSQPTRRFSISLWVIILLIL